jgi:hypothetical protein
VDDFLYPTAREGNFSYNVTLPNGAYFVTLFFAELVATGKILIAVVTYELFCVNALGLVKCMEDFLYNVMLSSGGCIFMFSFVEPTGPPICLPPTLFQKKRIVCLLGGGYGGTVGALWVGQHEFPISR